MEINLLDLFSGIGGFHLGLERAGFKNYFKTLNTDYQLFSVFVFTVPLKTWYYVMHSTLIILSFVV